MSFSVSPTAPRALGARQGALHTRKQYFDAHSVTGNGFTLHATMTSEAPFWGVRLVMAAGTAAALSGIIAKVAASAKFNGVNPVDGQNNAVSWSAAATWGGAASVTLPAGSNSDNVNVVLGAIQVSDIIPVASLARTDGTSPILMARAYSGGPLPQMLTDDVATHLSVDPDRGIFGAYQSGDFVTTPAGMNSPTTYSYTPFLAVQFLTGARGLSVLSHGDSTISGLQSTGNNFGAVPRACRALSTPALPLFEIDGGWPGQGSATTSANTKQFLNVLQPDVVVLQPFTRNDGLTAASMQAGFAKVLLLADLAMKQGTVPILATSTPDIGYDAAADTARQAINATIRGSGFLIWDRDVILSDGGSPARMKSGMSADGIHPNDAGYAAEAQGLRISLGRVLASLPR